MTLDFCVFFGEQGAVLIQASAMPVTFQLSSHVPNTMIRKQDVGVNVTLKKDSPMAAGKKVLFGFGVGNSRLDVKTAGCLDGGLEQFFFRGPCHFVFDVGLLDGSAIKNGDSDSHIRYLECDLVVTLTQRW